MKNLLVLTPIYPSPDNVQKATPVVHYFTREWVALGYNVVVCHYPANFPALFRWIAKPIQGMLESRLSDAITTRYIPKSQFEYEGVKVCRLPLKKTIPHKRYSSRQIQRVSESTISYCNRISFTPDVIIGHWVNPQVDIMNELKATWKVPTVLVLHGKGLDIESLYKEKANDIIRGIDVFGFRSMPLKRAFEAHFGSVRKAFYCFSGVPSSFLDNSFVERAYERIHSFIFVGRMIQRKFPYETLEALSNSELESFSITYIGQGRESERIQAFSDEIQKKRGDISVNLLGQIPRANIKRHLQEADLFIMMSKNEIFGLVYLEAMATGCIPIASRNEGFDGIIIDGENGFLCEAGNQEELTAIINKINHMSPNILREISYNARKTAERMTDKKVAENYINEINHYVSGIV